MNNKEERKHLIAKCLWGIYDLTHEKGRTTYKGNLKNALLAKGLPESIAKSVSTYAGIKHAGFIKSNHGRTKWITEGIPSMKMAEEVLRLEKMAKYRTAALNIEEAAYFLGLKKSYLYVLTSKKAIPFSKDDDNRLIFNRKDLEQWRSERLVEQPIIQQETNLAEWLRFLSDLDNDLQIADIFDNIVEKMRSRGFQMPEVSYRLPGEYRRI